ncbi:condensation domain-containing protein [Gordonia sinesedis]
MVSFGLIDDWQPRPGRLTSWTATPAAVAAATAAAVDPVPPSHQQEEYLRSARRNETADFRFSRLCLLAFDIAAPLNPTAMSTALTTFLRRHDTFRSWFAFDADDRIVRHQVPVEEIAVAPTAHGDFTTSAAIRAHIHSETPGPFSWDCFSFGAVEHGDGFTVYCAIDHLYTDGISQALTCVDLMTLYMNAAFGMDNALAPTGSYHDYCRRERAVSERLTRDSISVRRWMDLVRDHGGRLPRFPLPLDNDANDRIRSGHLTTTIFGDAGAADRFESACRAQGANVVAGVLAVAAIVYAEFTGEVGYLGMTPKSTRQAGPELNAVGWFTSLIPVPITVTPSDSFSSVVAEAAHSYAAGKDLTDVSFHRVLELVEPGDGITVEPGWSVPMVSYIDIRKLPGQEMFDAINGAMYGNRGSSEEVFMWVNRFPDTTSITLLYPDTPTANDSVHSYVQRFIDIMNTVANEGDYALASLALAR